MNILLGIFNKLRILELRIQLKERYTSWHLPNDQVSLRISYIFFFFLHFYLYFFFLFYLCIFFYLDNRNIRPGKLVTLWNYLKSTCRYLSCTQCVNASTFNRVNTCRVYDTTSTYQHLVNFFFILQLVAISNRFSLL